MLNQFRRYIRSFFLSLVVGSFPLVALWKSNLGQIPTSAVTNNLLYTFLFILLVSGFWLLIIRKPEKSALLSCATFLFVFSYGHLYNWMVGKTFLGLSIGYMKLFLIYSLLFGILCLFIIKNKNIPNLLIILLPVGLLFLMNVFSIAGFSIQAGAPRSEPVADAAQFQSSQSLPDIYYIVLDAYARNDVLKEVIGYDNTPFLEALGERGFYIPECAFSNYDGTFLTLASVLNYEMVENLRQNQVLDINLIHDNKASKIFRLYGYQIVTGRGFASFNDIQNSDVYLNYAIDKGSKDNLAETRFTHLYLNTTVFRVIAELYKMNPERFSKFPVWLIVDRASDPTLMEANFWYMQNNYMFDSLETIPEKTGNYFVYAHINAPHGPYVYNRDGSFRYPRSGQVESVLYADEITYINQRVLEMVDVLQKKSNPDPIIIIQGDHGIHKMTSGLNKHKILSAYYLPGDISTPLYKTITPVNNFRIILRNYFDPSIELLPDVLRVKYLNEYEPVPANCDLQP